MSSKSNNKVILITGTSSGIGKVTASLLAKREGSHRIFGTSRDPSKISEQLPPNIEMLKLDVDSDESVEACVMKLLERTGGRIDVLINNAGFVLLGGIEETPLDEARRQLETNLFGAIGMTKAVLPTMRKQRSGQIINIGSIAGHIAVPFQGYYAIAKFAMEGFSEALRHETKSLGIRVSIVKPGFFRTNIGKSSKRSSIRIEDYSEMRSRSFTALKKREENSEDPIKVAETIVKIIKSDKPKLHYPVGRDKSGLLFKRILPESTFEGQVRRIFKLDQNM